MHSPCGAARSCWRAAGANAHRSLLVKPRAALAQIQREQEAVAPTKTSSDAPAPAPGVRIPDEPVVPSPRPRSQAGPRRFYGTVELDPTRLGRDAGQIAEAVVQHLQAQPGAKVRVTLEIEAELVKDAPDAVVRTVSENARTLKFRSFGFEEA